MASYIPWYGKKRERLAERERAFIALLKNETSGKQLTESAEAVRLGQIRALKAKRDQLAPCERNADADAHLQEELQFWLGITSEQLIEGYRSGAITKHLSMKSNMRALFS